MRGRNAYPGEEDPLRLWADQAGRKLHHVEDAKEVGGADPIGLNFGERRGEAG